MISSAVFFPMGVPCATQIPMPVLCAATSVSAFALQEGKADSIHSIYQHLGVKPEHYEDAVRQMAVACSTSQWFSKLYDVGQAIRPTDAMVEEAVGKLDVFSRACGEPFVLETNRSYYLDTIEAKLQEGSCEGLARYIDDASESALRAGDIESVLAVLERSQQLLAQGRLSLHPYTHLGLAERWARLGYTRRAIEHMEAVSVLPSGATLSENGWDIALASVMTFTRMGSPVRAALAGAMIEDECARFSSLVQLAREMVGMRLFKRAEAYLSDEAFAFAKSSEDRRTKIDQIDIVVKELLKHGMKDSAVKIVEELIDPSQNLNAFTIGSLRGLEEIAWVARTMKDLEFPLRRIVTLLLAGGKGGKQKDALQDPSDRDLRRAQANAIRSRWLGGELDEIASEWEAL